MDDDNSITIPMVATTDRGGPYEPDSYLAGWEMGQLFEVLKHYQVLRTTVLATNLRQADMIAMSYERVVIPEKFYGGLVDVLIRPEVQ